MNFLERYPTPEQIASFIQGCQDSIDSYARSSQQRMENYYNCIDDYSYGGICDKAADQGIQEAHWKMEKIKNQTGPVIEEFESAVLFQDGKQVSDQMFQGKFGRCWIIKDGNSASFVGEAKKQATYLKKGFEVRKRVVKCEYYWTTKSTKSGGLMPVARVISDEIQKTNDPYALDSKLSTVVWYALNYQYEK